MGGGGRYNISCPGPSAPQETRDKTKYVTLLTLYSIYLVLHWLHVLIKDKQNYIYLYLYY